MSLGSPNEGIGGLGLPVEQVGFGWEPNVGLAGNLQCPGAYVMSNGLAGLRWLARGVGLPGDRLLPLKGLLLGGDGPSKAEPRSLKAFQSVASPNASNHCGRLGRSFELLLIAFGSFKGEDVGGAWPEPCSFFRGLVLDL